MFCSSKSRNLSFRYKQLYIFAQVDKKLKETTKKNVKGIFYSPFSTCGKKRTTAPPSSFHLFFLFFLPISALCKIAKLLCLLFFSFMQIEEKGRLSQVKKRKGGRARLLWVPEEKLKKTPNGQEVIIARFSNKLSTSAVRPS